MRSKKDSEITHRVLLEVGLMVNILNRSWSVRDGYSCDCRFHCLVMDKTHETQSSGTNGICEKIRRSLALSPAKQSFKGVSYVQRNHMPASKNMTESKHGFKGGVVPIEFDRSAFAKGKQGNGHILVEEKAKSEPMYSSHGHEDHIVGKPNNFETENRMNDKFSEYIHHAKIKISKTSSDVGARGIARLDSVNKRASAYISRARQRINNSATFRVGSFQKK